MSLTHFLVFLFATLAVVSPQVIDIQCPSCEVNDAPPSLPVNSTWRFLCDSSCTSIKMSNVPYPRFPREIFDSNPFVLDLWVAECAIAELKQEDFTNAVRLESLTISINRISLAVGQNAFVGAFELKTLVLKNIFINSIDRSAFVALPNLETLDLSGNYLGNILNEHFQTLSRLQKIDLRRSQIKTIENRSFLMNPYLTEILLSNNLLEAVDLTTNHVNYTLIDFLDNQIVTFSLKSSSNEVPVPAADMEIRLGSNRLQEVYIQSNFPIQDLALTRNEIQNFADLSAPKNLKTLNLGYNHFIGLSGQRIADKFGDLEQLTLNNNEITSFSSESFAGLDKVSSLYMDNVQLTTLDFPRMEGVQQLYLRYNQLTEFPYADNVRETFPKLATLWIALNKFESTYLEGLVRKLEPQGVNVVW